MVILYEPLHPDSGPRGQRQRRRKARSFARTRRVLRLVPGSLFASRDGGPGSPCALSRTRSRRWQRVSLRRLLARRSLRAREAALLPRTRPRKRPTRERSRNPEGARLAGLRRRRRPSIYLLQHSDDAVHPPSPPTTAPPRSTIRPNGTRAPTNLWDAAESAAATRSRRAQILDRCWVQRRASPLVALRLRALTDRGLVVLRRRSSAPESPTSDERSTQKRYGQQLSSKLQT